MASGGSRRLLLAWDVPAEHEEPWRRLLQVLSEAGRKEEYVQSRRPLGISAESVWLVPKRSGGGMAVVYLEAEEPEWTLRLLGGSEAPFDSWYSAGMGTLLGSDLARLSGAASGELFFAWRDDVRGEREEPNNS